MSGRWTLAAVALASLVAGNVVALEVRQVMRPPRYARGDENVRIVQPADTAAWIWMPGHDVFGVAACGEDAVARAKAGETPGWFFRFRNDFVSDGSPLRLDSRRTSGSCSAWTVGRWRAGRSVGWWSTGITRATKSPGSNPALIAWRPPAGNCLPPRLLRSFPFAAAFS